MKGSGIYDRIKDLADLKEISISEIERRCDLGNGVIRRWNESIPSADKIQRVAKFLNTSMDYLITGEDVFKGKIAIIARDMSDLTETQILAVEAIVKELKDK